MKRAIAAKETVCPRGSFIEWFRGQDERAPRQVQSFAFRQRRESVSGAASLMSRWQLDMTGEPADSCIHYVNPFALRVGLHAIREIGFVNDGEGLILRTHGND